MMKYHNSLRTLQSDSAYSASLADQVKASMVGIDLRTVQYSIQLCRDIAYCVGCERTASTPDEKSAIVLRVYGLLFADIDVSRVQEQLTFIAENGLDLPRSNIVRLIRFIGRLLSFF